MGQGRPCPSRLPRRSCTRRCGTATRKGVPRQTSWKQRIATHQGVVRGTTVVLLQLSAAFANDSVVEIIVVDQENGKKHAGNAKDGMWSINAVSASAL